MPFLPPIAAALLTARTQRLPHQPVRLDGRLLTEEEAYQVQDEVLALLRRDADEAIAGYKIGLTSQAMQELCGLNAPIYGAVLPHVVQPAPATIDLARYGRLGLEFEIALRIGKDVTEPPASWRDLAQWVEAACPAIELIDDRNADYGELDGPSIVAENAWNAGVVLGAWQPLPTELAGRRASISCNGAQADAGAVGDALAHPLAATHWLACSLRRRNRILREGMIVMTGSIIKTQFPTVGEDWRYEVEGLGTIEAGCR